MKKHQVKVTVIHKESSLVDLVDVIKDIPLEPSEEEPKKEFVSYRDWLGFLGMEVMPFNFVRNKDGKMLCGDTWLAKYRKEKLEFEKEEKRYKVVLINIDDANNHK